MAGTRLYGCKEWKVERRIRQLVRMSSAGDKNTCTILTNTSLSDDDDYYDNDTSSSSSYDTFLNKTTSV